MTDSISEMLELALEQVRQATSTEELAAIENLWLGRNKGLNEQRKTIGTLPAADRPAFGQRINEAVGTLSRTIEQHRTLLFEQEMKSKLIQEQEDVTIPGIPVNTGRLHPLTTTTTLIKDILSGMGFEFVDGPELEDYKYNFDVLNYPEDHPAMDEQNSFFITDTKLLRTQTTALQGRMMASRKPPFRFATVGRCYRYEAVDATHHHTFHQVDVFMVDQQISMADLKGTLAVFARAMFGEETQIRFRPDFFPFVEPGVDYSISWKMADGRVRWLELGGAGLIHPNILNAHGIDSQKFSGFAFGLGVERIHMLRTGVNDLRFYLDNDLRFLESFD